MMKINFLLTSFVHLGKKKILCVLFFAAEISEYFIYDRYKPFVRHGVCKHSLPIGKLVFGILLSAQS